MLKYHARTLLRLLKVADIALAATVFVVLSESLLPDTTPESVLPRLMALGLATSLAWVPLFEQLDLYRSQRRSSWADLAGRLLLAGAVQTALLTLLCFALALPVKTWFPLACAGGQAVALGLERVGLFSLLHALRRRGRNYRNVLVLGSGPRAGEVARTLQRHPEWGLRILSFVDGSDAPLDPDVSPELMNKLSDVPTILRDHVVDEVIVACPRSMLMEIDPVIETCAETGTPVTLLSDLFGSTLAPRTITHMDTLAALSFARVHHSRGALALKRGIDVAGSAAGLLLAAPVLGLTALAIKLSSPGPVFFRQIRCGLHGRPFEILKLRTMYVDAEERKAELAHLNEMDGPVFKIRNDPRITPVGRLLRRFSLDELPQLWNVLRGDMSLVGPRPPVPAEVAQYAMSERRRLSMRPGLTCLWQISGRNQIGFEDWVKLDLQYIDSWSLGRDVQILLRTVPAVLRGTGA